MDENALESSDSGSETEIVTNSQHFANKKKLLFKERPPSSSEKVHSEELKKKENEEAPNEESDEAEPPLLSAPYPSRMSLMILKGDIDPMTKQRFSKRLTKLNDSLKRESSPFKSLHNLQSSIRFMKDPLSKEKENEEDEVTEVNTGIHDDHHRTIQSQVKKPNVRLQAMQYKPTDLKSIRKSLADSSKYLHSMRISTSVGPSGKPRIRRRSHEYIIQREDKATQTLELCDLTQCQIDQLNWDPFHYWETQCASLDRALKFTKMCRDPIPEEEPSLIVCGESMELQPRKPNDNYLLKPEYTYPRQMYFNRYRTDFETICTTLHLY